MKTTKIFIGNLIALCIFVVALIAGIILIPDNLILIFTLGVITLLLFILIIMVQNFICKQDAEEFKFEMEVKRNNELHRKAELEFKRRKEQAAYDIEQKLAMKNAMD